MERTTDHRVAFCFFLETCHFFLTAHISRIFRGKGKVASIKGWDGKSLISWTATFEPEYDEDNMKKTNVGIVSEAWGRD